MTVAKFSHVSEKQYAAAMEGKEGFLLVGRFRCRSGRPPAARDMILYPRWK